MTKILIDTCVWFDLAKSNKGEKVLSLLEEFIKTKEVSLILPEIVITEFNRNKERVVKAASKSLSSHFDVVRGMVLKHGGDEYRDTFLSQLNDLSFKVPTIGESAFESIQRIENMFSESEVIEVTDDIKLRAIQRAIDKIAPFHLSKNSTGDAIIIESYKDFKERNISQDVRLMFVTHNKSDFSIRHGNQKEPHEDLSELFDSSDSQYFINLPEALNAVNSDLAEEIEFENDWHNEPRGITEMMEMDRELSEKIWYNRHQYAAQQIRNGEIKIIDREDFDPQKPDNNYIKDIWEGAKKSAKAVEDKYGKENLVWDDFEWGMLNGKLSAIRWVVGEEWDELYT